jgi:glycosyltransferase involved in cell wall biosynthesis
MERMLLSSASEWRRAGYSCDVLATAATIGPLAEPIHKAGYNVFHIPIRSKFRYLPRFRFIADFFALCRSGYDIVHVHTETAVPVIALIAKAAGVEGLALTPHNTFCFSGMLRFRKTVERWIVRLLGGRYGMISDGVRKCEWETFRNPGVRTWNWLDTNEFRPPTVTERIQARQSLGCRADEFVIVSVGNCNNVKNHRELLRAIHQLPSTFKPLYLHVGKESEDQRERDFAAQLAQSDHVRFCGSQDDTRQYLWAADAYVMPSLREGLSIAAIEAIAAGAPAIFSDIDGLRDIAAEAKFTMLCEPSADSIAEALIQLSKMDPEERKRRALEDSDRIRERFSVQSGVRSVVDALYREVPAAVTVRLAGTAH